MGILYQYKNDFWFLVPIRNLFPIQLFNTPNIHNSTLTTPTQLTHGNPTNLTILIPIWHTHSHTTSTNRSNTNSSI